MIKTVFKAFKSDLKNDTDVSLELLDTRFMDLSNET